jgi:hypothetical protein
MNMPAPPIETPGATTPSAPSKPASNWLALSASVISLIGLVLTLLGYGVSLAVESMFGMPHAALIESGFDLLDLASFGLMQFLEGGYQALGGLDLYLRLYASAWPTLVALIVAWLIFMVLLWRRKVSRKMRLPIQAVVPANATAAHKRVARQRVLAAVALLLIPFTPLLAVVGVWVVVVFVAILGVIPVIGMSAGVAHVEQWVVAPDRCMPRLNRDQWLQRMKANKKEQIQVPGAFCVAIIREGKAPLKGRVVFMTSKSVVLFDPSDGSARKVPLTDAVIEALPAL